MPAERTPFRFIAGATAGQLLSADNLNSTADELVDLRREVNRHLTFPPPNMDFVGWAWGKIKHDESTVSCLYTLTIQRTKAGLDSTDSLDTEDDTLIDANSRDIRATNLAEIETDSHTTRDGTIVQVWMFRDPITGHERNFFSTAAGGRVALLKINGNLTGGGKYTALRLTGDPTTVSTGNLSMPEGMVYDVTDDQVYAINVCEDGVNSHDVETGSFHLGLLAGVQGAGIPVYSFVGGQLETVITDIQWNNSTGKLQFKTEQLRVLKKFGKSAWTDFGDYYDCT